MKKIGGNTKAEVQVKRPIKNEIGESTLDWVTIQSINGFLDFSSEESTHTFICDYVHMNKEITSENSRLIINGATYEVKMIDDPMGLHYQLEFSLKYTGGQSGS